MVRKRRISVIKAMVEEFRTLVSWRAVMTNTAILVGATVIAWLAAHADPRGHNTSCRDPSDLQIILFILALTLFVGAMAFGLGETVQWSLHQRAGRPHAAAHGTRAAILMGLCSLAGVAAGYGFMALCY